MANYSAIFPTSNSSTFGITNITLGHLCTPECDSDFIHKLELASEVVLYDNWTFTTIKTYGFANLNKNVFISSGVY